MFLPASLLPVILGTAWGWRAAGGLDLGAFALALAAVVCVHGAVNVLNDVYDDTQGGDRDNRERIHPFTGGSRFIQNAVMTRAAMARWGAVLLAAGAALGLALALRAGAAVLGLGLLGVGLGLAYSLPPVRLSDRGLGELAVGLGFGVLPVAGAAWLQSGRWDADALWLSLPVAVWVALVLLANEVPDARADAAAGKRTLVVRLGPGGAARLYLALQFAAALPLAGLAAGDALPWGALAVAVFAWPSAVLAARDLGAGMAAPRRVARALRTTLAIHALGCLWLTGWVLASG
jgi:1,4-dihydroxy-2-naphthoate octaprenyltransferase